MDADHDRWPPYRGRLLLGAFLLTEAAFYPVHNTSGAFLSDLPAANPVVLIASILGYVSTVAAIGYWPRLLLGALMAGVLGKGSQADQKVSPVHCQQSRPMPTWWKLSSKADRVNRKIAGQGDHTVLAFWCSPPRTHIL